MTHGRRIFILLAVAAALMMLAACGQSSNCNGISFGGGGGGGTNGGLNTGGSVCGAGSGNGNAGTSDHLFYLTGGNNINTATLSGTTFQATSGLSAPSLGAGAGKDMVVVNQQYLYVTWTDQNAGVGEVLAFSINKSNGALTALPGNPFVTGMSTTDTIAADPKNRFVFVGDSVTGDLAALSINLSTGALTLSPFSPLTSVPFLPTDLAVDGSGKYLYATEGVNGGDVFGFTIDQNTGDLTEIAGSPFFVTMTHIQTEPTGAFLLGTGTGSEVDVVPIEAGTGALLEASEVAYPTVNPPNGLVVHPTGKFVYVFGTGYPMEGFSLTNGVLATLPGSPYTAFSNLKPYKFDQAGTTMFGMNLTGGFGVRIINPATGAVSGGITDLGVVSTPSFAVTN